MKKHILTIALVFGIAALSSAQCDPQSFDWGSATYGVSPNPNNGETFNDAILGQPYADNIYVLAPTQAGDIDPTFENFNIVIDSLSLDSITIFNNGVDVSLSSIGLNVTCNNNGDSPEPCMFLGGHAYCGDIIGTPTIAGEFPVKIYVTVFVQSQFFSEIPYQFENYTLKIVDPNLVQESAKVSGDLVLNQNAPNPADASTMIYFNLPYTSDLRMTVQNLLGEKVFDKMIQGKRGENNYRFDTSSLQNGIYLYNIQLGDKKITRRMIVQH